MTSPGIKGAGVVPIILWSRPHQFGKQDGGGAGGGGDPLPARVAAFAPPTLLSWFTRYSASINMETRGALCIGFTENE